MTPFKLSRRSTAAMGCGLLLALGVGLAAVMIPARAPADDNSVIARVNGIDLKEGDLGLAEEEVGAQLAQLPPEARREQLINYSIDVILVSQAAEKQKLGDTDEFKRRAAHQRIKLLMESLLQKEIKAAVNDEAMRKVYDEATKQMGPEQEVRARHILVATEEEAKAIVAELKQGGDFAELAKKKSKDTTAAQGGDLDYFTKGQMVPEFAEAAFKLEKGQTSEPVKSQFGWHVIKVEDKRDKQPPAFESVKSQIETYLSRKAQADLVAKLRQEAKIERLESNPPPAADAPKK